MKKGKQKYPLVDLFAGPGGLGEGFERLMDKDNESLFKSIASIERDQHAHQTLELRHFFRSFRADQVPDEYFLYIAGSTSKNELKSKFETNWLEAKKTALRISLGPENHDEVKEMIDKGLQGVKKWALIGGPPCQAYSLVGRSRMKGTPGFEEDERHFLYKEYLKTIIDHKPPVFVMENVKGLLSARVDGELVIEKILKDLSSPVKAIDKNKNGLNYRLYSLSQKGERTIDTNPKDFIVKAEDYGVPQARHRMFILGIRSDLNIEPEALEKEKPSSVFQIVSSLPKIRSGISRQKDTDDDWKIILSSLSRSRWSIHGREENMAVKKEIDNALIKIQRSRLKRSSNTYRAPKTMQDWFFDERLIAVSGHESRSHMADDLRRYLFASSYASALSVSPKLRDFPKLLLPKHENVEIGCEGKMFSDRFRVQVKNKVSTTITSHISKDGHYFIHYDPAQCRSLTVREAARLQTFPDNYHFEGPRTSQYHQVGNAVPSYLANKIAMIVKDVLDRMPDK